MMRSPSSTSLHRVVALCRVPAGVDGRAEHVGGVSDLPAPPPGCARGGSRTRGGRRAPGARLGAARSVSRTSAMPPSRSTSSAVASRQAEASSPACCRSRPARLTSADRVVERRVAIWTWSGVAQRQLRCAIQRSSASKPAAAIAPAGRRSARRTSRAARRPRSSPRRTAPTRRCAVADLRGDVVRAHERERERGRGCGSCSRSRRSDRRRSSERAAGAPRATRRAPRCLSHFVVRCGTEASSIRV